MSARQPAHLRPESCYVCGYAKHADSTAKGGHKYWSNAEARAEFAAESAQMMPTYSNGAHSPEESYVREHRPE